MNYWKHSLLSRKKFGGLADDYLSIHKFLDSSKLFYYHYKHRALLHNTYGIELSVRMFGETLVNSDKQTLLVRDIAAEHCKEDLLGMVPTLHHWFAPAEAQLAALVNPVYPADEKLKEFVLLPWLMSGLKSALIITHSNFGVHLVKTFLGVDYALEFSKQFQQPAGIPDLLQHIPFTERWQVSPDLKQLKHIENGMDQ